MHKISTVISALLLLLLSSAAYAVDIAANGGSGSPGDTVMVTIDLTTDGASDATSFRLLYDEASFDPVDATNCSISSPDISATHDVSCSVGCGPFTPPAGMQCLSYIIFSIPAAVIPSTTLGPTPFVINAATPPGVVPLTFDDLDSNIGMATPGAVMVNAPAGSGFYSSTPAPGDNLDLGTEIVGTIATAVDSLSVDNLSPDTDFDITALSGMAMAPGLATIGTPATPITVPFGDNVVVDFTCTPGSRGDITGDLSVEHDSAAGAPSPVAYTFNCAGLAPLVQIPAGPVMLNGVTVDPADPSAPVTITNDNADGFSSIANNLTAVAGAGDPQITVMGGPTNLAAGATFDFTVSCDRTADFGNGAGNGGTASRTIDFTWDNPDPAGVNSGSIQVDCTIINEVAEYESVPAEGSTLDFGLVLSGVQSAPLGIDIGNSDNDGIPNGTLMITGATITGDPEFNLATDPAGTMVDDGVGPDGVDDAEVTCTPSDTFSTFTATLSIMSNDPDSPHDYPLTCTGDSDAAFDSNPAPGGLVDFGFLLPGMDADQTITFLNSGTVEDLTATDCTLSGDPEFTQVSPPFPATIPASGSLDVVLNCAVGAPGLFTGSLNCDIQDSQGVTVASPTYDLRCTGAAVEVPTLSRFGLIALVMTLMLGGFIAFRLRQN